MEGLLVGTVVVPGLTALLVFFILTYLHHQSHALFFRAWQIGWALYVGYFTLNAWSLTGGHPVALWLAQVALLGVALCALVSTRLFQGDFHFQWYDFALAVSGTVWAAWNVVEASGEKIVPFALPLPAEAGIATILVVAGYRFWSAARLRDSLALHLTAFALALWAFLLAFHHFDAKTANLFGGLLGYLVGTLPQMLLAIAMVMVQNETERRSLQENLLAFSSLSSGSKQSAGAAEVAPALQALLDRLGALFRSPRAAICIAGPYRETLPSLQGALTPEFLERMERDGGSQALNELLQRHGGV